VRASRYDFVVSHGYWYILRKDILDLFPERIINLHISLLPWNRGIAPNLWSWVDDTPKGVTIHHVDTGVDTGDVIVQKVVDFGADETLRTSYARLQSEMHDLFALNWEAIRSGRIPRKRQSGVGSLHTLKERLAFEAFLPDGWDTPVSELPEIARRYRASITENRP
jgi:methionyl-tRNA formyltransferase